MDQFTLTKIQMTPQLGELLKNFRLSRNVQAKTVTSEIGKTAGWLSKLEKGVFTGLKTTDLIEICNVISGTEDGVRVFIESIPYSDADKYSALSAETKLSLDNIEDLVVEYDVNPEMVDELQHYMDEKSISIMDLSIKLNSNVDICDSPDYHQMKKNIWLPNGIRFDVPERYVSALLSKEVLKIHPVIAEGIFYAAYLLGDEQDARLKSQNTLAKYSITRYRFRAFKAQAEKINEKLKNIDPEALQNISDLEMVLTIISAMSPDGGKSGMRKITDNMNQDRGFYYAYMRVDLSPLKDKTRTKKQEFLNRLRSLVSEYTDVTDENDIELYD